MKNNDSFQVDSGFRGNFHAHFTAMHYFRYSGHTLHGESVDLVAVAQAHGTPTYVYSAATMADNYTRLARGLASLDLRKRGLFC